MTGEAPPTLRVSRRRAGILLGVSAGLLLLAGATVLTTTAPLSGGSAGPAGGAGGGTAAGRLLLALAVCIAAGYGGGLAAHRWLGQPPVVGQMLTGILLGPSLLGAVVPGPQEWLFTSPVSSQLDGLAQLGIALFVYFLARELSGFDLRSAGAALLGFSAIAMVVPFILGVVVARQMFPVFAPAGASTMAFALLVGVVCGTTAVPVLGAVLADLGLSTSRIGVVALTSAVLADGLAWCGMTAAAAAQAGDGRNLAVMGGRIVLFGVGTLICVRLARGWRERREHVSVAVDLTVTVVIVAAAGACTALIGIHPVVGAFVAGLCGVNGRGRPTAGEERLREVTHVVLLPLFFVTVGLRLDVSAFFTSGSTLAWAGLMLAAAGLGKLAGAVLPARLLAFGWGEALQMGVLLNCRGVTDLIVLDLGRHLGLVGPGLYTYLAVIILLTTVATTPLMSRLMRRPATAHVGGPPAAADGPLEPAEAAVMDGR